MNIRVIVQIALCALIQFTASILVAAEPDAKQVVATVNDQPITAAEVTWATPYSDRASAEVRKAALEKLIDNALLVQAVRKIGYKPFPKMLQERIQAIVDQNFNGDQAKFEATLEKQGWTLEMFKKLNEESILATEMRGKIEREVEPAARKQAVADWLTAARAKATITYN